jgi:hypothetical protein
MAIAITIEPESASVPATMFRLLVNSNVVATGLSVSQAHLAIGEVLLQMAHPKSGEQRVRLPPATQFPIPAKART